jgi:trimethylamine--corrinoid protein Co-methyltransferase
MRTKLNKRNMKKFHAAPLEYLTQEQKQDIHAASLEVLEDVGTVVHYEEAVELLEKAGARIKDGKHVFIPAKLVEEAIQMAPSSVTIYNRNREPAMFLEGCHVYYGTGSDCPNLLDSFTGERRSFLYKDVKDSIRLVDALPNIDFTMCNGLAADISPETQYQYKYALMIRNTSKPQVITAGDKKSLSDIADIAACLLGSRDELIQKPIFVLYDEPTSPLVHTKEALEKLLFMAENQLPINYSPGMMAGASGPVTIAGAITLANAEILAGLVIHQLKNPGAPFIFGAGMSPLDMSSM